jgi:hypothetical protein
LIALTMNSPVYKGLGIRDWGLEPGLGSLIPNP